MRRNIRTWNVFYSLVMASIEEIRLPTLTLTE
jgi:hypothetical protein